MLAGVVEGLAQLARGVSGVGEVGGGPVDELAGVGVVVESEAAGVLLGAEPAAELAQQLREPVGHDGELGDEPVEFGRAGQRRGAQGAVGQLADGLGRGRGDIDGGRGSGTGRLDSLGCGGRGQVSGVTPCPATAWDSRTDSPEVWQTWAWCRSLSTVAVARVLGMSSSKAPGCRFEEIPIERFS